MYKLYEEYRKLVKEEPSYTMSRFLYKKTNELIIYDQIILGTHKSDKDQAFVLLEYRIYTVGNLK